MDIAQQQVVKVIGALKLGVIPPDENIEELLASLSVEEARLSKRKYRKIKRKLLKEFISKYKLPPQIPLSKIFSTYCYRVGLEELENSGRKM